MAEGAEVQPAALQPELAARRRFRWEALVTVSAVLALPLLADGSGVQLMAMPHEELEALEEGQAYAVSVLA